MPSARLNYGLRQRYLDLLYAKFLPDRRWDATAIHRSDLIYCLRKAWYRYNGAAERHSEKSLLLFLRGRVLHEMLAVGDAEQEHYPLTAVVEHIDDVVDGEFVEKKTTVGAYGEPPRVYAGWKLELALAAAAHPERKVNLFVLHLLGAGRYNKAQPDPMFSGPWEYAYTEAEVADALAWFAARRDVLAEAMAAGVPPSTRYRQSYECKDCPFVGRCVDAMETADEVPDWAQEHSQ